MPTIPLLEAIVGSMGMPNRRLPPARLLTDADVIDAAAQQGVPSWQLPLSEEGKGRVARNLQRRKEWEQQQGAANARMNPSAPGFGVAPVGPAVSREHALQGAERDYAAQASRDLGLDVLPVTKSFVDSTGTTPVQLPNGKVMLVGPKARPEPNPGMNFRDWDSLRKQQPGYSERRSENDSERAVVNNALTNMRTSPGFQAQQLARATAQGERQAKVNDIAAAESAQRQYQRNPQGLLLAALRKGGQGAMPSQELAALNPQLYGQLAEAHLKGQDIKGRIEAAGLEGNKQMMPMLVAAYANMLSTMGKEEADNALNTLLGRFGLSQPSGLAPGQASIPPVGPQGVVDTAKQVADDQAKAVSAPIVKFAGLSGASTPDEVMSFLHGNREKMSDQELEAFANFIRVHPKLSGNRVLAGIASASPAERRKAVETAMATYGNQSLGLSVPGIPGMPFMPGL